jgi:alpha-mannosidase
VLYKGTYPLDLDHTVKPPPQSSLFAINNLPNYPRQEVVAIPLAAGDWFGRYCAQVSDDGKTGYVLVDAIEGVLGVPKGLYANVPRVTGESGMVHMGGGC